MRSSTETLIAATRILSRDIKSTDRVANAALREVADRLTELDDALADARQQMAGMVDAGELQAAERKSAITLASLRVLSRQWKEGADGGARDPWVFINDLDRILETT